jgi:hypothetical protein
VIAVVVFGLGHHPASLQNIFMICLVKQIMNMFCRLAGWWLPAEAASKGLRIGRLSAGSSARRVQSPMLVVCKVAAVGLSPAVLATHTFNDWHSVVNFLCVTLMRHAGQYRCAVTGIAALPAAACCLAVCRFLHTCSSSSCYPIKP